METNIHDLEYTHIITAYYERVGGKPPILQKADFVAANVTQDKNGITFYAENAWNQVVKRFIPARRIIAVKEI